MRAVEGFSANDTPELSEQLRDLLLENEGRKADEADELLGCTAISIKGGVSKKMRRAHFFTKRRTSHKGRKTRRRTTKQAVVA